MNEHKHCEDLLPLCAADQLSQEEQASVEKHLLDCAACRSDLEQWRAIGDVVHAESSSIAAPPDLADRALAQIHTRPRLQRALAQAWQLLNAQAKLIHRELWPACAAVMAIGVAVALLAQRASVIRFLAPLVGAATLAAYLQALETGRVDRSEQAVLFNCGNGLKYPMPPAERRLDRTRSVDYRRLGEG